MGGMQGMGGMPGMGGMGGHSFGGPGVGPMGGHSGPVKDKPITRHLGCTLEELFTGSTRKLKITRTIFGATGQASRTEEEILEVNVKPGWKKGTKVTFPDKGEKGGAWRCGWWRSNGMSAAAVQQQDDAVRRAGLRVVTEMKVALGSRRNAEHVVPPYQRVRAAAGASGAPFNSNAGAPPAVCAAALPLLLLLLVCAQVTSGRGALQQTWCSS
jgi:hypothetical protein